MMKKTDKQSETLRQACLFDDMNYEKVQKKEPQGRGLSKKEVRAVVYADINHRVSGRTPKEKREQYARYRKIKKRAQDFESTNQQYLVLFPASDINLNKIEKFYNMGWFSAKLEFLVSGPTIVMLRMLFQVESNYH